MFGKNSKINIIYNQQEFKATEYLMNKQQLGTELKSTSSVTVQHRGRK